MAAILFSGGDELMHKKIMMDVTTVSIFWRKKWSYAIKVDWGWRPFKFEEKQSNYVRPRMRNIIALD